MATPNGADASLIVLPVELLRRIASYTTCSTVFNLFLTHRRLYEACNDRLVFKNVAETSHGIRREEDVWLDSDFLLNHATLEDTKKTAFAVERAVKLYSDKDNGLKIQPQHDLHEWLPHLMALRHPRVIHLDPVPILDTLHQMGPEEDGRYYQSVSEFKSPFMNMGFLIVTTFLARRSMQGVLMDDLRRYAAENSLQMTDLPYDLSRKVCKSGIPRQVGEYGVDKVNTAQCSAICVTLAASIHLAFPAALLPSIDRMSLHEWMAIPPVYRSTMDAFAECHVTKMIQPDFLSSVWEGYYSDNRGSGFGGAPMRVDPKMENIRLVVRALTDSDSFESDITAIIDSSSGGSDRVGSFTLHGVVHGDGQVQLVKQYLHAGWSWRWRGKLMPYGIVGMWGENLSGQFGGYFWIWKKEWAA